jgi:two-component system, OmpR family, phosphate regulon sensor histidine kinase PhoR
MTRGRHLAVVALAAAPLLIVCLLVVAERGGSALLAVVVWAIGFAILEVVLWRTGGRPQRELLELLGVASSRAAGTRVRELTAEAASERAERERTAALVEDLSSDLGEGLVVVDTDLRIRLINRVALRFCGIEQVRAGAHLLELFREPEGVEAFQSAAGGGRPDPIIISNPRGLWEVRAFPVRGGGAVGLLSEVSLIRRASEFRRRFVQDLSHELRSPLTVLRTTVEAMEDELPAELAEMLVRQVERVDRLASELNELSSIESGQVDLELGEVAPAEVVRDVLIDFRPEAARSDVDLRCEVPDDLRCWCDRRGLYRVLSNLVDNAVKYNRPGGWVRLRGRSAEGSTILEVSDSGEGIPASELQAVLQRFYRVDRARTPGRGGLGLGLAIVKHLVQVMGGTLALDSREGVGTTVTLSFPIEAPGGELRPASESKP